MTSPAIRGYEPPPPPGNGESGTGQGAEPDTGSAADVAKEHAAHIGQSAKDSGKQVVGTAADEAKNVTAEARRQAKDLTQEVGNQAQQQAAIGKDKAASGLHAVSDELRAMASHGGQTGPVTDLVHEAADKATDLATWLENRDPGALLDEVRSFARRRPGTFLLGAAAAGIVAGRLTRGVAQAGKEGTDGEHATSYGEGPIPIADSTGAEARLVTGEPETAPNGYEPAGLPL